MRTLWYCCRGTQGWFEPLLPADSELHWRRAEWDPERARLLVVVAAWYEPSVRAPWLRALLALGIGLVDVSCRDEAPAEESLPAPVEEKPPAAMRVAPSMFERIEICPKRLADIETVDRVIPAGCGPLRVDPSYRLDAGSLTIKPGAILEFEVGAELALGFAGTTKVVIQGRPESPVILRPAPRAIAAGEEPNDKLEAPRWPGIRLYKGAVHALLENIEIERVGDPDRGALYIESHGASVKNVLFRDVAGLAVYVNSKGGLHRFSKNRIQGLVGPTSMFLPAASMRALTADNEIPSESSIRLLGDHLYDEHLWANPGVPVIIGGRIEVAGSEDVSAKLTLSPGVKLHFDDDGYINVGYYDPGVLIAEGTPAAPILLTAHEDHQAGAWRGINLYKHASASFAHVVFENGARYVDRGVLYANSKAELGLRDVLFRDNRSGVVLYRDQIRLREFRSVRFEGTPRPLKVHPQVFGELGTGNDFGGGRVLIDDGVIGRDTTWRDPGVVVELRHPISVEDATFMLTPGLQIEVGDGFGLEVGDEARLRILGAPERPVTIVGINDRRGTWDSIHLKGVSEGAGHEIRGLRMRNAGGDAAIVIHAGVRAAIEGVSCEACFSPTLTWQCGAVVDVEAVEASAGTPGAIRRPECMGSEQLAVDDAG